MRRWLSLGAGAILIVIAFATGLRVADTREGLMYEIVTLFAGLAGVSLLLYGLVANSFRGRDRPAAAARPSHAVAADRVHSLNELLIGGVGLVVAALLVVGLAASGGALWAVLGFAILLPMVAGCGFLCYSFIRGPQREWRLNLQKLSGPR
jgi:hypothetical protein